MRSPPAYTVPTSAASGAGAPVTRTPSVGETDPALLEGAEPDGEPDGVGASDVQAPRAATTSTAAVAERVRGLPRITLQP